LPLVFIKKKSIKNSRKYEWMGEQPGLYRLTVKCLKHVILLPCKSYFFAMIQEFPDYSIFLCILSQTHKTWEIYNNSIQLQFAVTFSVSMPTIYKITILFYRNVSSPFQIIVIQKVIKSIVVLLIYIVNKIPLSLNSGRTIKCK